MNLGETDNQACCLDENGNAEGNNKSTIASAALRKQSELGSSQLDSTLAVPSKKGAPKSNGTQYSDLNFLIERILPVREVHILGGPSGAGKTRWLFQMLQQWKAGDPVLGYPSNPVPFAYISTDRSRASVMRTLEDLGIDPTQLPVIAAVEKESTSEGGYTVDWLFGLVKKEAPNAKLMVVEGLGGFVPKGQVNDYNAVAKFLRQLTRECQKRDITFLGVHHTSKSKEGEGYNNPREKLLGSAAWAAYCETILVLDFYNSSEVKNQYRVLHVLPRNHAPNMRRFYLLDQAQGGRLVETSEPKKTGGRPRSSQVDIEIEKYLKVRKKEGVETFSLKDASAELVNAEFSESTLRRRLEALCEQGRLKKTETGEYGILDTSLMEILLP